MQRRLILTTGGILLLGAVIYVQWPIILDWAIQSQRQFQNAMANGLRAARSGDPWAVLALCAATFSYGFVHALGPGHGKIVLGGAAVGSVATYYRMIALSVASALAQSLTAILLVMALVGGARLLTGTTTVDLVEGWLRPLSYLLILGIGLILVARGLRQLFVYMHQETPDSCCGHAHGPTVEDLSSTRNWYENLVLIVSIAIRPCSGALFLLIIAARLDLMWFGVLATFSMGLGTALFNVGVATSGVMARRAIHAGSSNSIMAVSALLHLFAGGIVILLSWAVLMRLI